MGHKTEQTSDVFNAASRKGILQRIKIFFDRNKLGELLVYKGIISSQDLAAALSYQKQSRKSLGSILIEFELITKSQLRSVLGRQMALRFLTACFCIFISLTSLQGRKAKADSGIKDIPTQINMVLTASTQGLGNLDIQKSPLFGMEETQSRDLSAFTKWKGMFDSFDSMMQHSSNQELMNNWVTELSSLQSGSVDRMARKVNDFVNASRYITDDKLWGKSDYWATPVEFLKNGGDCEDFAIAKYTALRALGVPETYMRVAIVHDNLKNIPHAVLIVFTERGPAILDNQIKQVRYAQSVERYTPIFSINRDAWWLHTKPERTVLASR